MQAPCIYWGTITTAITKRRRTNPENQQYMIFQRIQRLCFSKVVIWKVDCTGPKQILLIEKIETRSRYYFPQEEQVWKERDLLFESKLKCFNILKLKIHMLCKNCKARRDLKDKGLCIQVYLQTTEMCT